MWIIEELSCGYIVCYPQGDRMIFASEEAAKAKAEIISANNSGVFVASPWMNGGMGYLYRRCLEPKDATKLMPTMRKD